MRFCCKTIIPGPYGFSFLPTTRGFPPGCFLAATILPVVPGIVPAAPFCVVLTVISGQSAVAYLLAEPGAFATVADPPGPRTVGSAPAALSLPCAGEAVGRSARASVVNRRPGDRHGGQQCAVFPRTPDSLLSPMPSSSSSSTPAPRQAPALPWKRRTQVQFS